MTANTTVRALEDETMDALVWRVLRRTTSAVEAVLRANPGLADVGPFLPRGQQVMIPSDALMPVARPLVQLWT